MVPKKGLPAPWGHLQPLGLEAQGCTAPSLSPPQQPDQLMQSPHPSCFNGTFLGAAFCKSRSRTDP